MDITALKYSLKYGLLNVWQEAAVGVRMEALEGRIEGMQVLGWTWVHHEGWWMEKRTNGKW